MIDIHCHLLPGIDDGPDTMGEALTLARLAVKNGITHSVVTPHIHPGRYENTFTSISNSLKQFKAQIKSHDIPLQLGMAAEVRVCPEIFGMIDRDEIPFLGEYNNKKVILLEFPHNLIPMGSDRLVQLLLKKGILPMIAHPERNKDIMSNLNKVQPFVDLGCLFQLTASSVSGYFGLEAQKCAHTFLRNNWCTVLASDGHNVKHRPPNLQPGVKMAQKIVGESAAWDLVYKNPSKIVSSLFASTLLE